MPFIKLSPQSNTKKLNEIFKIPKLSQNFTELFHKTISKRLSSTKIEIILTLFILFRTSVA